MAFINSLLESSTSSNASSHDYNGNGIEPGDARQPNDTIFRKVTPGQSSAAIAAHAAILHRYTPGNTVRTAAHASRHLQTATTAAGALKRSRCALDRCQRHLDRLCPANDQSVGVNSPRRDRCRSAASTPPPSPSHNEGLLTVIKLTNTGDRTTHGQINRALPTSRSSFAFSMISDSTQLFRRRQHKLARAIIAHGS